MKNRKNQAGAKAEDRPMPTDPRELARALFRDADRKQMRKLKKQKTSSA